ncbi:unnamed protein product [Phytophthora fragariaefolia]|uniref:Unnamed protein product n=1 Tax=Phytophthora fragariaefolia TaxID=1490495 RepID=A0A9W6XZR8_9STRA|nr:unnamed protein product [Phytophthora fragariaefolia]
MMRKKYGRRDTMFDIQQRLSGRVQQPRERLSDYTPSLQSIGFGKRVPEEACVQAFVRGINRITTATQVPKRRYRADRSIDEKVEAQPTKPKTHTEDAVGPINWNKLSLGFGGDDPPTFDTDGKPVGELAKAAKREPLSLAALQAMIYRKTQNRRLATLDGRTEAAAVAVVLGQDAEEDELAVDQASRTTGTTPTPTSTVLL